ncbi:MAG: tetratricopeptide repeat protein [Thermoplasmata archaeon]|nr:MAG: tetratricopeptide repeat protein [Thermoplasmata archaeon]
MAEGKSIVHNCPLCGNSLDFIEKDNAWYCKFCKDYRDVENKADAKEVQPSVVPSSTEATQRRCFICLGLITDENESFECECGSISHDDCIKEVGNCSVCKIKYTPEDFLKLKDFVYLIKKGKSMLNKNRYKNAQLWFSRALKIRGNSTYAWNCKGMAYAENCQFEEALQCYDKAIELKKNHEAYYNKAITLLKMKSFKESLECVNTAISLNRDDANSWYVKGLALSKMRMPRIAIKCYDKALDLVPENGLFWYAKGKALIEIDRSDPALDCFESALEIDPKDINALFEKGRLLARINRIDEAKATFDEVLKWEPEHTGAIREKEKALARG